MLPQRQLARECSPAPALLLCVLLLLQGGDTSNTCREGTWTWGSASCPSTGCPRAVCPSCPSQSCVCPSLELCLSLLSLPELCLYLPELSVPPQSCLTVPATASPERNRPNPPTPQHFHHRIVGWFGLGNSQDPRLVWVRRDQTQEGWKGWKGSNFPSILTSFQPPASPGCSEKNLTSFS